MKRREFVGNSRGISMMYDAVLFIVMVSLSGVVLLPALQSDIAVETSVERHREKLVDETLLMLMNTRADKFEYVFAGSQIDAIASLIGINVSDEGSLFNSITKTLLGNEQLHKTYADLCVENLASQLKVFGYRINIFTEDYDVSLNDEVTTLLQNYLGDKYGFNLTIQWHPIIGVPFGGDLAIGPHPPDNTHVATSDISMPNTFFSTWWNKVEQYIPDQIMSIEDDWDNFTGDGNETKFRGVLEELLNDTINGILFDGFDIGGDHVASVLEESVDYVFGKIEGAIDKAFGEALTMISESLGVFESVPGYTDLSDGLARFLIDNITALPGIEEIINISSINIDGALDGLKTYIINETRTFLHDVLDDYIQQFIDIIMDGINSIINIEEIEDEVAEFFTERINVLRAKATLTIWEVRG